MEVILSDYSVHLRHAKKPRVLIVAELNRSEVRRDELHGHHLFVHRGNSSSSSVRANLHRQETYQVRSGYHSVICVRVHRTGQDRRTNSSPLPVPRKHPEMPALTLSKLRSLFRGQRRLLRFGNPTKHNVSFIARNNYVSVLVQILRLKIRH